MDQAKADVPPLSEQPAKSRLSGYVPLPGVADELIDESGAIRPVWQKLVRGLEAMSAEDLAARISRAELYLRDSGVFFRQYDQGDKGERDWPLSFVPVLVDEAEWAELALGLGERADLLEQIVADIYGDNTLVKDGHLPASLIAENPEWLRPLVGTAPKSGHFLHFVAFDIGRSPQGHWWVLADRMQAPSGIGFSLENRIATRRAFAEIYERCNVHRVASFFQAFRDALVGQKSNPDNLVALLTPGPYNESYFEHAYIARYLGLLLVEGEDLCVEGGKLKVRTIEGLHPVDVLWRRLDARWADPLELDESSYLGTGGMVGAIRDGSLVMINALGTGILETRALQAFIPRIARVLTGEPLRIPNIATWWCGHTPERERVKANADDLIIGSAFSTRLPIEHDDLMLPEIRDTQSRNDWIDANARQLVGQEAVTLSTTPALEAGQLVPRPMSLRVYLARTPQGWTMMPSGFARIGQTGASPKLALQLGGSVADVWVISKTPVMDETLLKSKTWDEARDAYNSVALPSKAADNLYWLGRYVERSETAFRLLRAYHYRLAESGFAPTPLLDQLAAFLKSQGIDSDTPLPKSVLQSIVSAKRSAGHVRDRFSTDGWLALNDLARATEEFSKRLRPGDDTAQAMGKLLRKVSGFSGLLHDNMYHFTGWRLLSMGRAMERALFITELLAEFANDQSAEMQLALALEVGDSTMSHRRRFGATLSDESVADMLALDPLNPRSILHQLNEFTHHLGYLPGSGEHNLSDLQKKALKRKTALTVLDVTKLDAQTWRSILTGLHELSSDLSARYLS